MGVQRAALHNVAPVFVAPARTAENTFAFYVLVHFPSLLSRSGVMNN